MATTQPASPPASAGAASDHDGLEAGSGRLAAPLANPDRVRLHRLPTLPES